MSKIIFINCKVFTNKGEQNYTDFSIELESIKSLNLIAETRICEIKMKDDTDLKIQYYDPNNVIM